MVEGVLAFLGFWLLARQGLGRLFRVDSREDETHWCVTSDGLRLALARYLPTPGSPQQSAPVVLIPGLSTDRFSFDLVGADGLPQSLQKRGFEVWIIELRGHGRSDGGKKFDPIWGIGDYRTKDLPCAFEEIRKKSGAHQLHVVGHSMGGILMYLDLARLAPGFASLTTVASSLQYASTGSAFEPLLKLHPVARWLPTVPIGEFTRLWSIIAGLIPNPLERFNSAAHAIQPWRMRRFHAHGFRAIPVRVLIDHIPFIRATTTEHAETLAEAKLPVLAISGSKDQQCPPEAVTRTASHLAGARRLNFEGYGHLDLLIGDFAARDVHPAIVEFIEAHPPRG